MASDLFDTIPVLSQVRTALISSPLVKEAEVLSLPGDNGADGKVVLTLQDGTVIRADLTVIGHVADPEVNESFTVNGSLM